MNLSVDIAGVTMKNPVTTGSGTFGSGEEFSEFVDLSKLGAVTTKGVANVPWPGNPVPRVAEVYGGMLNAIGLQNPGIDVFVERDIPYLKKAGATIIVERRRNCFWTGSKGIIRYYESSESKSKTADHHEVKPECHRYHRDGKSCS